jgi:hypothetical protein
MAVSVGRSRAQRGMVVTLIVGVAEVAKVVSMV